MITNFLPKKIFSVSLVLFFSFLVVTPSLYAEPNTRRVVTQESYPLDGARSAAQAAFYLPQQILSGSMKGIEDTSVFLSDPDVIKKIKDILYIYERKLAWFPTTSFGSGFRPNYGGGLYFHDKGLKSILRGSVHDSDYWTLKGSVKYTKQFEGFMMAASLSGLLENKDDRRYYGLGSDPEDDSRNRFINLSDQDYGIFTEQRKKLQWKTAISHHEIFKTTYLGYYQRRGFEDTGRGSNPLRDIYDLTSVPGFTSGAVSQIYNELSVAVDTRKNLRMISPGFRAEIYGGFSAGIRSNSADFFRGGVDVAGFIPTIREDRLLVPRLAVDVVEDVGSTQVPFTEYPRHHSFRGLSSRSLIANDELSVAPSLEYQWPISHLFSGHLFFDTVFVGRDLGDLDIGDGIWAVGAGINLHYMKQELGRFTMAGGSEGFQISLTLGVPIEKNSRGDW